nr:bile acid:sodium symporter family protein [Flexithrix dorotheae]
MKTIPTFSKILLGLSLISLIITIFLFFSGDKASTGPFIIILFTALALGMQGIPLIKGLSFTFWIFAAVSASLFYPEPFREIENFQMKLLIVPLLQIIMFGMGSQMSIKDFKGVIQMPKGVFIGMACQFSIMPIVGFTLAVIFGFPAEIAAGFVLVGSSPSGLASNVMSFIAKANLALSVTLTAVATMLAPLITPTLMKLLAGEFVPINFWEMMLSIINIVILPIIAGLIFNAIAYGKESKKSIIIQGFVFLGIIGLKNLINFTTNELEMSALLFTFLKDIIWFLILPIFAGVLFHKLSKGDSSWLEGVLSFISMAGIAVIISIITAAGRDSLIEIGFLLILACLIHNCLGYFLGYWTCKLFRLDEKSCRTIALEVGLQNGGLASGIALEMGRVATVGLAPAVFGPMMNITGSSLATWWRGKPVDIDEEKPLAEAQS